MISASEQMKNGTMNRSSMHHELGDHYDAILRRIHSLTDNVTGSLKTIGITACARGAGVSTVASNLAIVAAQSQMESVLLIDTNYDHPSLHRNFGIDLAPGFAELFNEHNELKHYIHKSPFPKLDILPAGRKLHNQGVNFSTPLLRTLHETVRKEYELVVFDLPAVTTINRCLDVAGFLDGILLVVEAEKVRSQVALKATDQLRMAKANLLGAVFNKRRNHLPGWLYRAL